MTERDLKEWLTMAVVRCEPFRRICGPNHHDIASELAKSIIKEMGIEIFMVRESLHELYDDKEKDQYLREKILMTLGRTIATEGLRQVNIVKSKPTAMGYSQFTAFAPVITRFPA